MSLYVCKRDIPKKARKRWKSFDSHLIDSYSDVMFFVPSQPIFPILPIHRLLSNPLWIDVCYEKLCA